MKLRNLFARPKLIRTFEELQNSKEPIIAYREKPGHREGAGSLFQDIISAQILCNLAGKFLACPRIRYLHHHKSAGDTLEVYLQKWADVFAPLDLHQNQDKYSLDHPYMENPKATLDSLPESQFEEGIRNLRELFTNGVSMAPQRDIEIAVHLRNGNPEDEIRGAQAVDYALYNETFSSELNPKSNLDRLLRIQAYLLQDKNRFFGKSQKLKMTIISQGKLRGIEALEKEMAVEYLLDEHPVLSFNRMLKSDLLIIGQSSFSYLASLLRKKGSISMRRFRHRLPENCLIAEIF
jgi:hypothetical protein